MGGVCQTCTVWDDHDPDVRERKFQNIERRPRDNVQYPVPELSVSDRNSISHSVSDRRALFEDNGSINKTANKKKAIKSTETTKPKKKWKVKGIDVKNESVKQPINAGAHVSANVAADHDREPSVSLSHQDRMLQYQNDLESVRQKEKDRLQQHKEARGGYDGVKISSDQMEKAKQLMEKRVESQKKGELGATGDDGGAGGGGISTLVLSSDMNADVDTQKPAAKKRTLNEVLKEATDEDAHAVISSLGLLQKDETAKDDRVLILNLNNNNIFGRLLDEQKQKLVHLIAHSVVSNNAEQHRVEKVAMCNAGIDDTLMVPFMRILVQQQQRLFVQELLLETNKIGDDGMNELWALMRANVPSLTVIKLYNNKKDVSTSMCNQMLDALEENDKIVKFTFSFRLQQQKDKLEKILRRNQEIKRRSKAVK